MLSTALAIPSSVSHCLRNYVDNMEMDATADRVVFERVSPSLLDWLCVLQNSVDKLPTSRFSHSQTTALRLVLREFLFSTNPLHFSCPPNPSQSPDPAPGGDADPSLTYETCTLSSCNNSANHAVDANRVVRVAFHDLKMEKKGRSTEPEGVFKLSVSQLSFRTAQPQSELHHQYKVSLHRRRSYRGQFTESQSRWTAMKFAVCFRLGPTDLRLDKASMDSFGIDLVNATKNLVDFRAFSEQQRDKARSDRPDSPHTPAKADPDPDPAGRGRFSFSRSPPSGDRAGPTRAQGSEAEQAAALQSYEDCNRPAATALLLPTKVFEGKEESSHLLTAAASSIEWSHPDPAQRRGQQQQQQQCKVMALRLGEAEVWVSVAAAIKTLSAMSNLQLFLRRVLGTMAFAKKHGLVFDRYIVPQSRARSVSPVTGQVDDIYSLTSFECSRIALYVLINPGSGKSVPQKLDWALLAPSAKSNLTERQPENDHSKSFTRPKAQVRLPLVLAVASSDLTC